MTGGEISSYDTGGFVESSGSALGASMGGSSSGSNAVSKASLYLTGGINVDRLYLGGKLAGSAMKSDNSGFWKALEMQVIG